MLSEGVEPAEDVVGQLTAGDASVALSLRQLALATLHQLRSHVIARSVLDERLARLLPTRLRSASVQRLVFQHRQQTANCTETIVTIIVYYKLLLLSGFHSCWLLVFFIMSRLEDVSYPRNSDIHPVIALYAVSSDS